MLNSVSHHPQPAGMRNWKMCFPCIQGMENITEPLIIYSLFITHTLMWCYHNLPISIQFTCSVMLSNSLSLSSVEYKSDERNSIAANAILNEKWCGESKFCHRKSFGFWCAKRTNKSIHINGFVRFNFHQILGTVYWMLGMEYKDDSGNSNITIHNKKQLLFQLNMN